MRSKFINRFETRCAAIALSVLLGTALSLPAHASGAGRFDAGYSALLRHDHDRAITRFTDAIETGDLRPNVLALAYHYRGAEYLTTGRDDEAIADFDRALALNPNLSTVYNDRAIAFRRKGDFTRAIADYNEAIRLMPGVHSFYLNRGLAYAANRQFGEAIADYKVALRYKADSVPAFVALGNAHMQEGRNDDALAAYRQAMHRKGDLMKEYPWVGAKLVVFGAMPPGNVTAGGATPITKITVVEVTPTAKSTVHGVMSAGNMIVLNDTP
jgi:tetratricopeptide (TPR) repeat protein